MTELREGDPVWVDQLHGEMEPYGEPFDYTGPGVVWADCRPRGLMVQTGLDVILWIPNPWNVVPYRREPCQYGCDPLRLLVKGRAGEGVRWLCASCGGEQDR